TRTDWSSTTPGRLPLGGGARPRVAALRPVRLGVAALGPARLCLGLLSLHLPALHGGLRLLSLPLRGSRAGLRPSRGLGLGRGLGLRLLGLRLGPTVRSAGLAFPL